MVFTGIFLLVALFTPGVPVDAHDSQDQAFEPDLTEPGGQYSWVTPGKTTQRSGQQFTPTASWISGVDVAMADPDPLDTESGGAGGDTHFTAKIRVGSLEGIVLGTATAIVDVNDNQAANPEIVHFDFSSSVPVTPGQIHVLEISGTGGDAAWGEVYLPNAVGPGYASGAWVKCEPSGGGESCSVLTQFDRYFATYAGSPIAGLGVEYPAVQQAELLAPDLAPGDFSSWSVAISGDTAVVGSRFDTDFGSNSGSANVYTRDENGEWTHQAKLTASDASPSDLFGTSLGIDGDTIVVGAMRADIGAVDGGAAYVFVRNGVNWTEQQKIIANDFTSKDNFGYRVDIDADTIVVSANEDDDFGSKSGSAYVYVRTGSVWAHQAKLNASDAGSDDKFGSSVAISGGRIVVGAVNGDSGTANSGAAYVFERTGSTWPEAAKLIGDGVPSLNDNFGFTVDIDQDTVIVGAYQEDDAGGNSGSAYTFVRDASGWPLEQKLHANDEAAGRGFGSYVSISGNVAVISASLDNLGIVYFGAGSAYSFVRGSNGWVQRAKYNAEDFGQSEYFGAAVAVDGDTAIVGAQNHDHNGVNFTGSAYIFVPATPPEVQEAKLEAPEFTPGETDNDRLGWSVDISGDTAIVGSRYDSDVASGAGAAQLFVRNGTTWTPKQKLTASDGSAFNYFGLSVAISGDTAVVGAPSAGGSPFVNRGGAAYVFTRTGDTWSQVQILTAGTRVSFAQFGTSVGIDGNTIVVGAFQDHDSGVATGAAYVFTRAGGSWTEQAKLTGSAGVAGDLFGVDIDVSGDSVLVGAGGRQGGPGQSGQAYVFDRTGSNWSETAILIAGDAANRDFYGRSVGISGDTAVVGAQLGTDGVSNSGSAYVFSRSGGIWSEVTELTASDANSSSSFGSTVAISGEIIVAGAKNALESGSRNGAAYVYVPSNDNWIEHSKLTAEDGVAGDQFGYSVGVSGDTAITGAVYAHVGGGIDNGTAYIFVPGAVSEPPVLTIPDDISVEGDVTGGSNVSFGTSAIDTVDGSIPVTCTPSAGSLFEVGDTLVTCEATNSASLTTEGTFTVTVTDTTKPLITAPTGFSVDADTEDGATSVDLGDPTVSDIVDAAPDVTNNAPALFPFGDTTVTWTVEDASGNEATADQIITVGDTTAPVITAPPNITMEATAESPQNVAIGTATATDDVDPNPEITNDLAVGFKFPLGPTTVIWTATDESDNDASANQIVTINDTTSPTITAPADITVTITAPGGASGVTLGAPTVSDIADPLPVVTHAPGEPFALGETDVIWTATDASTNQNSATQVVTVQCDSGYYHDTGSPDCVPAPAGTFVPAPGATTATVCGPGTYQTDIASASCDEADSGYFAAGSGSVDQTACGVGYYQPDTGETACLPAPAGHYVGITGAVVATLCGPGTYQPGAASSSCDEADAGHFVAGSGSINQTACGVGYYQPDTGEAACLAAPSGHYVDVTGAVVATPCGPGTFQGIVGSTSCNEADSGHFAAGLGSAVQTACGLGYYQPDTGKVSCLAAPSGHYVGTTGADAATQCDPGTYQSNTGQPQCIDAPPGSYVDSTGAIAPTPCAAGTFQPNSGAMSCEDAEPGRFVQDSGSHSQQLCPAGTYQPNSGATSCLDAQPGHFVSTTGAIDQTECAAGFYQPQAGQQSCLAAPLHTYVPLPAAPTQTNCPVGTITLATGTILLIDCLDLVPPVLSVPANIVVEATGPAGAFVTIPLATATDVVDPNPLISCTFGSGQYPVSSFTVECTATDAAGNHANGSFTVSVVDTIPPDVTVPSDITLLATSFEGTTTTFTASATDIVGVDTGPTCDPESGSLFEVGSTVVTCSATDTSGNTGQSTFTVTVLGGRSLIEAAAVKLGFVDSDDKEFEKTVKHLDKALLWDKWIDEGHPDTKHGKKVFDEIRHAVKHLEKLLSENEKKAEKEEKGNKGKGDKKGKQDELLTDEQIAAIECVIDQLMTAAKILAATAISDAKNGTALDPEKQEKVEKEIAKAEKHFEDAETFKKRDEPINDFKKAWEHALHAIKHQNKPPESDDPPDPELEHDPEEDDVD